MNQLTWMGNTLKLGKYQIYQSDGKFATKNQMNIIGTAIGSRFKNKHQHCVIEMMLSLKSYKNSNK